MESEEKVEMIKKAIAELMMEEKEDEINANKSLHQHNLLTKLLSELEWLEEDKGKREVGNEEEIMKEKREVGNEEIMKELKNVQRQNSITHYLLSGMILLTLAWQLSQVSLILRIKNGITNPFNALSGFLKSRGGKDVVKAASDVKKQLTKPTYIQGIKIPTFDFPGFDSTATDEDDDDSSSNII